jgi:endothelin-converting enzyme/putative endopeptidase
MNNWKTVFTVCVLTFAPVWPAATAQTGAAGTSAPDYLTGLNTAYIDKSVDPCQDFYQYACGKFSAIHPIPADHSSFGNFELLFDENEKILHAILEKAAAGGPGRTANEQKIGDYYATCLDSAAINSAGLKPLKPEFDRIDALKNKAELTELLAHDQLVNVSAFLAFGVQQDLKDARKQIAVVDQGGLGLPERDYYLRTGAADEKLRKQYVQHVANMFKLLGKPETEAAADAQKVMDLETALAKVSLDVTSQRDPKNVYHITSVPDLEKLSPAIDWTKFLAAIGAPPLTDLNVTHPPFFKGLNALLDSTDLDTIKVYLTWQLLNSTPSTTMPQAFDEEQFSFNGKVLSGQPEQRPRWKRCVQSTDGALGEALGQVYASQAFPPASKAATRQMVDDIEAAMDADIDTLDWMSADTKAKAKEKLKSVANKIGYPDKWRDYSNLSIVRGDAFGNALRAIDFENKRQLNKIGKPVDRGEFGMSPPTVNAYYNPSMNDINFPAGILQPPFYDPKEPDAVNYGHIGVVVGHELTHGFDDQGRQFDGSGNLNDWWTESDGKKFDQKADCEVKEYGEFSVAGGVKVNGKLTLGENTADNGGLRLAYIALLADAKRKNTDMHAKQSDGYTPAQQFFLGYAQNWCGFTRPEQETMEVQTNPHAPNQFRVNGVVRNMEEFGPAFGCKAGQPMTPANACRVW